LLLQKSKVMEHDSICYICKPKNPLSPADNRKERISLYLMKLKKTLWESQFSLVIFLMRP